MSSTDRRAFLERSLEDLDAEHEAGDLSDEDHARLRALYESRLAGRSTGRTRPQSPARPPRRRGVAAVAWLAVVAVATAGGLLLAANVGRRDAGEVGTGGISQPDAVVDGTGDDDATATTEPLPEALAACLDLTGSDAIDCYSGFTAANPDDPAGWTQYGLFAVQNGIAAGGNDELFAAGESFLRRALDVDPGYVLARVYLAVVLERTGQLEAAAEELARLDGVDVPADLEPLLDLVRSGTASLDEG